MNATQTVDAFFAAIERTSERVERLWIGGLACAIECHGMYLIDAVLRLVGEVRDYMELSLRWDRLGDVLAARWRSHSRPSCSTGLGSRLPEPMGTRLATWIWRGRESLREARLRLGQPR